MKMLYLSQKGPIESDVQLQKRVLSVDLAFVALWQPKPYIIKLYNDSVCSPNVKNETFF